MEAYRDLVSKADGSAVEVACKGDHSGKEDKLKVVPL